MSYSLVEESTASTFKMYLQNIYVSHTFFVHGTTFLAKRKNVLYLIFKLVTLLASQRLQCVRCGGWLFCKYIIYSMLFMCKQNVF